MLLDAIIAESSGKYKETMNNTQFDFKWCAPTAENDELYKLLSKDTIINRYPNIKEMSRKDTFEAMMSLASDIDPEIFDFVPPSFILPRD